MANLSYTEYHMSLREVAAELNLSTERVRQIERAALKKVRLALVERGLGPTVLDAEPETGQFLFEVIGD